MQIRAKLTLQFIVVVTLIIALSFFVIFYSSSNYRRNEFYTRLEHKGRTIAEIFFSVPSIDSTTLRLYDSRQKDKLPRENIVIYDKDDHIVYSNNDSVIFPVNHSVIEEVRSTGRWQFSEADFQALGLRYTEGNEKFVV